MEKDTCQTVCSQKVKKVDILIPQNAVKYVKSSTTIEISLKKRHRCFTVKHKEHHHRETRHPYHCLR